MGRLQTTLPSAGFSEQILNNREGTVQLGRDRPCDWSPLSRVQHGWYWLSLDSHIKFIIFRILCESGVALMEVPEVGFPRQVLRQWCLVHSMECTQKRSKSSRWMERTSTEEHTEITLGGRGTRATGWPQMPGESICASFYRAIEPMMRSSDPS